MVEITERKPSKRSSIGAESRVVAAQMVHRVRDRGQSLTRVLQEHRGLGTAPDQALAQEMTFGTLRMLPRLEAIAAQLLHRPLKNSDRDLECLILVGLYQLEALSIPAHAAVSATVAAAQSMGKQGKSGLVNALLRRFQRERAALLDAVMQEPQARWLFPLWLLDRLRQDWPRDWQPIIEASNGHPPMALRVNEGHVTRDEYAQSLARSGIRAQPISGLQAGLLLDSPMRARDLPGFQAGDVSVQDSGAQLAAELLDAQPGQRVLDACAAPGGKTAAILERAGGDLELTAIDLDADRLETVRAALKRLGLSARIVQGDASAPAGEWTHRPFERILLDVPCSATGVIRRHPDIKWLRRPEDISALSDLQQRMLDAMWPLLAEGGRLLYATCSLLSEECHRQIAAFLARRPDARELDLPTDWGVAMPHGRQLLPTPGGHDGFFYALLEKAPR